MAEKSWIPGLNKCCLEAINSPGVNDFVQAVKVEVAHQRERWKETDPLKTDADWYWLIGWLGGKAVTDPHEKGDKRTAKERKLHRIVTVAAAAFNWFDSVKREEK